jgi:ABC-type lipopolysaccharide export system ATPase subunit
MKVKVKNLGVLKQAEFEVGDLTIICGGNNTGKTYATYALYGFLYLWDFYLVPDFLDDNDIDILFTKGSIKMELDYINKNRDEIFKTVCANYLKELPAIFAASEKYFVNTTFEIIVDEIDFKRIEKVMPEVGPDIKKPIFSLYKKLNENFILINIIADTDIINDISKDGIIRQINAAIAQTLFKDIFPKAFIASIERTGAALFRNELDFSRNRLLERLSIRDKDISPNDLLASYFDKGYALPVNHDVDFIRTLENVFKTDSIIAKNNPDILESFDLMSGGKYISNKEGLYFIPENSHVKLTMGESASSVRSLLNLGVYIKHIASPGSILMIDEPELNLHPMNQRRMARLLAKLVNAGVKVFITTHSDYILKEFNTLIMLNNNERIAGRVMNEYDYSENELLDIKKIKAYIAKKALIKIEGVSKRKKCNTFIPAKIDRYGIEIAEFDDTINVMNEIQEKLYYEG